MHTMVRHFCNLHTPRWYVSAAETRCVRGCLHLALFPFTEFAALLVTGYPKNGGIADEIGHELVSGGEYRLEGDVIQFFDVAEQYRQ